MSILRRMKQQAKAAGIDPATIHGRTADEARADLERKAGPTATKFVGIMLGILEQKGGIADEEQRKKCGAELTEILRKDLRTLLSSTGHTQEQILMRMADVLGKYGVTDNVVQEDIILDFLVTLKDLGGVNTS